MTDAFVFTARDNAYFFGNAADYNNCYDPRWGRFKNRMYPSPRNHEYDSGANGIPYFDYFGDRAGPMRSAGFYSFTLGNWHIISLNSNVGVGPGQEQFVWLSNDLEVNSHSATAKCTLAYWHHPPFTSGPNAGSGGLMKNISALLYQWGVDVVVNGPRSPIRALQPAGPERPGRICRHPRVHRRDRRRAAVRVRADRTEQRGQDEPVLRGAPADPSATSAGTRSSSKRAPRSTSTSPPTSVTDITL
jgi:hypothetical protein